MIHEGHVWNGLSDVDFLKKLGAAKINSEDGKVYPTAAGLLMFGYESEILYEYPQYFLDYQEHFDESIRWSDRFVSSSGEWSGNESLNGKTSDKLEFLAMNVPENDSLNGNVQENVHDRATNVKENESDVLERKEKWLNLLKSDSV